MPDRVVGRRSRNEDEWHWLPVPYEEPKTDLRARNAGWNILLAALGAALFLVGIVLLAIFFVDGSGGEPRGSSAAAPTASAQPTATDEPPPPIAEIRLFVWSRQDAHWFETNHLRDNPPYDEGEAVPFMLQIMGAANGGVYDVTIEYQCRTPDGAAFDYLAGVSDETDDVALTTAPAPARRDDASILLPDEPSIDADVPARRFRAWGASFEGPAEGPLPAGDCESTRQITVSLHAQGTVPVLMWGGHLASDEDWGEGQGASSQPDPISMRVSVNGSETKTLTVAPDAIGP